MTNRKLTENEKVDISRRYGLMALGYAAAGVAATGLMPNLGKYVVGQAHASTTAKHSLRFGTLISEKADSFLESGVYHLATAIQEKSDGEIAIQLIDKGQACAENTCAQKVANGVLDMGTASSTNLSSVLAYSNAIDWPMLWTGRTEIFNYLFSPDSEKSYRGVLRSAYGVEMLSYYGDMRSIYMGLKYSDLDEIRTPDALKGAKIRISVSEMFQNFTQSLGINPIPLAWVETLEGMKSGVVDAMETFPSAAAGYGMTAVSAQAVDINFSPGVCPAFVSSASFDKLPDRLKEVVYEASWEAQKVAYEAGEVANNLIVGSGSDPAVDSNYQKLPMKDVRLTDAERAVFADVGGVEANMDLYGKMRSGMDKIAGFDVFGEMKEQADALAGKPIDMQKWWL
jgi:TRAP-type C4-dicarboxylate transport system substrate-binding protein